MSHDPGPGDSNWRSATVSGELMKAPFWGGCRRSVREARLYALRIHLRRPLQRACGRLRGLGGFARERHHRAYLAVAIAHRHDLDREGDAGGVRDHEIREGAAQAPPVVWH